jgi:Flp pilus assembly pilin Flp
MIDFIKNFHADEDGAVTVDWVVLTAAVVGLGIAAIATVQGGVEGLASSIASGVNDATIVGDTARPTVDSTPK